MSMGGHGKRWWGDVTLSGTGGYAVVVGISLWDTGKRWWRHLLGKGVLSVVGYIFVSTHVRTMVGGGRVRARARVPTPRERVCARVPTLRPCAVPLCAMRVEPTTRHAMREDAQRCALSNTSRHAHQVVAVPSQAPVERASNPSSRALLTPLALSQNAAKQGTSQQSTGGMKKDC